MRQWMLFPSCRYLAAMYRVLIHLHQPAASETAASAGVASRSECWIHWVSYGCLMSPSSKLKPFGLGLRVWTQPVMPLSICAPWELMPSWDLLPDGWCSHCKQLTASLFSLFPAICCQKRGKWYTENEALLHFYRAGLLHKFISSPLYAPAAV